jgi:uncharacterized repeat protein (TIGR01451 family)
MKKCIYVLVSIAVVMAVTGCACMQAEPEPLPVVKPAPAPAPAPAPVAKAGACGNYTVSQNYLSAGAIRIDKTMPATVQLNAPFEYVITATNTTDMLLSDVVIRDRLQDNLKYVGSTPEGALAGNMVTWKMDTLGPKASEKITVKVSAGQVGCVQTCADATYVVLACAKTEVVQPALALVKTAPERVTICENIPFQFTVTNKGTGTATNVRLTDTLANGLKADGKTTIDLALGNLAPGQSVSRTVVVKADKTGTYRNQASAVADGNLKADSGVTQTVVTQPVLTIEKTGSKNEWIGRTISYDIVVANKGDAPAVETVVTDTIPGNVTEVKASDNGQVAAGKVTWNLGTLAAGASRKLTVSYKPSGAGEYKNEARATAVCTEAVAASAATQIAGIPAVLLEVIDVDDPIEVGKNETYIIVVTNQGSAPDTDIKMKVFLEDSMEFVSAGGATRGSFADGAVTFDALPSLAPKAKAEWRVVVKAVKAGDVRLRVTMNTKELQRDVMETEATRFFE